MASDRERELAHAALDIVAEQGLSTLSVRTLAAACGVSIGTVQYHFATKQAMLVGAFEAVIARVTARVSEQITSPETARTPEQRLSRLLAQLLPLDEPRLHESRVVVAFAAAAATDPALAEIQGRTLQEVRAGIAGCLAQCRGETSPSAATRRRAAIALATTDGLALHAVSSPEPLPPAELRRCLQVLVDSLTRAD